MPDLNVASCVLNILGSFQSSQGLYQRLREKRRKQKWSKRNDTAGREELRLSSSLRQGHDDIMLEYQQSLGAMGDHFAIGDAIAQTSLAEILLRLNVGLIGIITSFLQDDKKNVQLDYKGLADLSDRSRVDTCRALRQLYKRLTHFGPQKAITSREFVESNEGRRRGSDDNTENNSKRSKNTNSRAKIRGTQIAQVYIENSQNPPQYALVRPGERRKRSRTSSGSESSVSKTRSDTKSASSAAKSSTNLAVKQPRTHVADRAETSSDVRKPRHKHSAANVSNKPTARNGDGLRASKSTPRLHSTLQEPFDPFPPVPNSAPLPAESTPALVVPRRRKPTPTYYSIASDSTKLGEIPLHKWANQPDFDEMSLLNQQAYRNGWPNDPSNIASRKKRAGLFGLFRRVTD